MKNYTAICFFLAVALILCPLLAVPKAKDTLSANIGGEADAAELFSGDVKTEEMVKVMSAAGGNVTELSLREYLISCVAAEMGGEYESEALKAQAVASHTLLLYKRSNRDSALGEADISDTAQKMMTESEQKEKWGEKFSEYRHKIEMSVDEVISKVICFDSSPIMATFFALSNGKTENAENVWGKELPYLVPVDSPDDKLSPSYSSAAVFTTEDFKKAVFEKGVSLSGDAENWIGETVFNNTGTVKSITIGEKAFSGTEIRTMFSLKSATFTLKYENDSFVFAVSGYGHGVGMSQYGANEMAKKGLNYEEILSHYYKNTVLTTVEN